MVLKRILAAVILAASMASMVTTISDADAATKKTTYKVVKYKKVVKKKIVIVKKYTPPKIVTGCTNVTITGGGQKKGLLGTENKVKALAVADWERQARARFGNSFGLWASSAGQQISCKRDVVTVRCLAISQPCSK